MTNPNTGKPHSEAELLILRGWHSRLSKEYRAITQALWRMRHPSKYAENQKRDMEARRERAKKRNI